MKRLNNDIAANPGSLFFPGIGFLRKKTKEWTTRFACAGMFLTVPVTTGGQFNIDFPSQNTLWTRFLAILVFIILLHSKTRHTRILPPIISATISCVTRLFMNDCICRAGVLPLAIKQIHDGLYKEIIYTQRCDLMRSYRLNKNAWIR